MKSRLTFPKKLILMGRDRKEVRVQHLSDIVEAALRGHKGLPADPDLVFTDDVIADGSSRT